MELKDFIQVSPNQWTLKKEFFKKMNVDAEIIASQKILQAAVLDGSIQQVINVASLPEIVSKSLAMPDIHYGYGFCIGGVAAFPVETGIVLPGGVGYDINCGVRLLSTEIDQKEIINAHEKIGVEILRKIPTGLTKKYLYNLKHKEFMAILKKGAAEIVNHYSGDPDDLKYIESGGQLEFNRAEIISKRAFERGKTQIGTLGSGNHFIEIQAIDKIFDPLAAEIFGLKPGKITIMIHTGSRGFGHQIASDYIERFRKKFANLKQLPDQQLIYTGINSSLGKNYLEALNAASNFAWANRHMIMELLIEILENVFNSSKKGLGINLVYDQTHNIAKFEDHILAGKKTKLLIHRKGATRAFPPGHPELPDKYAAIGQPVILPGSMGSASYILKGTEKATELTFASSAHGAGRRLSRHKAVKVSAGKNVREDLRLKNIFVYSFSDRGLREEIPEAYKEIDEVVDVTEKTGISKKVARLIPLLVVKS